MKKKLIKVLLLSACVYFIFILLIKYETFNTQKKLIDGLFSGKYDTVISNFEMSDPGNYEFILTNFENSDKLVIKNDMYNRIDAVQDGYILSNFLFWHNPLYVTETTREVIELPEEIKDLASGIEQVFDTEFGTVLVIPNYYTETTHNTSTIYNVDTSQYTIVPGGLAHCSYDKKLLYCGNHDTETSVYDISSNKIIETIPFDEDFQKVYYKTYDNVLALTEYSNGETTIKIGEMEDIKRSGAVTDLNVCMGYLYTLDLDKNVIITNHLENYKFNISDYDGAITSVSMACDESSMTFSLLNSKDNTSKLLKVSENGTIELTVEHELTMQLPITLLR